MKKNHAMGGKVTATHTTIIDVAEGMIAHAQNRREISKIVLGVITQVGTGKKRVRFTDITTGLLVTVRGSCTLQEIRVFTRNKTVTREALFRAFWGANPEKTPEQPPNISS